MPLKKNIWGTQAFRQRVVNKLEEAVQKSSISTSLSSGDMEKDIFRRSNSKGEYVAAAARLILDYRRMERRPDTRRSCGCFYTIPASCRYPLPHIFLGGA